MARNKHPEETANLILDTALRLFMEKGYEHTSIQDIINQLGGLSKGAIYHHFKSKEDILAAVTDRITADSNRMLQEIRDRKDMNGKDKLKAIFRESLLRPVQDEIFTVAPDMSSNPRLMYSILKETMDLTVPDYIQPILEEGSADGSILAEHPKEVSEMLMLLTNFWLNPMIFNSTVEESCRKFQVLDQVLQGMGLDVFDEDMKNRLEELTQIYREHQ